MQSRPFSSLSAIYMCVFVTVLAPLRTVQVSVAVVGMKCLLTDVSSIVPNAVVAIKVQG